MHRNRSCRRLSATAALAALSLSLLLGIAAPPSAAAVIPVYDAPNWLENLLNRIQTYTAILQRIQQIYNQYRQIELALRNLEHLDGPLHTQVYELLFTLGQVLRRTQGIVYSLESLDAEFRRTFPGWQAPPDRLGRTLQVEQTFRSLETLRAALLSTRELAENYVTQGLALEDLKEQALAADGTKQALESQSMILAHTANQVQLMTQQLAVATNAQAVADALLIQRDATAAATFEAWMSDGRSTASPPGTLPAYRHLSPY